MGECPRCGESWYKIKENDEAVRKEEIPTKVLWYLPIIPRFRRLFSDKNNAKLLICHVDERKKDGILHNGEISTESFPVLKNLEILC